MMLTKITVLLNALVGSAVPIWQQEWQQQRNKSERKHSKKWLRDFHACGIGKVFKSNINDLGWSWRAIILFIQQKCYNVCSCHTNLVPSPRPTLFSLHFFLDNEHDESIGRTRWIAISHHSYAIEHIAWKFFSGLEVRRAEMSKLLKHMSQMRSCTLFQ